MWHVTGMGIVFKCSARKPEEIRHRPKHKAEIIKENITEMGLEVVDQICLLQGKDQWHACVNVVMNLCTP
jgi:hypothetical protein